MDNILEVNNLHLINTNDPKRYLVKGASFSLKQREILALVGQSGGGKSLTALSIMNLLPDNIRKTSGNILYHQKNIDELSIGELTALRGYKVSMILQNPMSAFDSIFTIYSHFANTIKSHESGVSRDSIIDTSRSALKLAGISNPDEILGAYPFQMSGGMLQRVMIGLAIIGEPELLIADECTTDLDTAVQQQILDLLLTLRDNKNLSILLITHDLSVAAHMANRIAVMHQGEFVELAETKALLSSPKMQYTKDLIAEYKTMYTPKFTQLTS